MGYDFHANNPEVTESFYMGAFSWPILLEAGIGLLIGCGKGMEPGSYLYIERETRDGSLSEPYSNDGFPVTEEECKVMAVMIRTYVRNERTISDQWEALPESHRALNEKFSNMYRRPIRSDFVDKYEAFADWIETSGGFEIW